MVSAMLPINDTYVRAVELWVHMKLKDENINPADGIIYALTDSIRPRGVPEPCNTVQLCEVLAQMQGLPPLTSEEKRKIEVQVMLALEEQLRGRGTVIWGQRIVWMNRIGFLLGAVALGFDFTWWTLAVMAATWFAFGSARAASQMNDQPSWVAPTYAIAHLFFLAVLYCMSIWIIIASIA